MAVPTPQDAVEALINSVRAALQCVARAEVWGSAAISDLPANLVIIPFGSMPANTLLLRRSDRTPYLHLEIATEYTVIQNHEAPSSHRNQAIVTKYMYAIKDLDGRELFAYHWHPVGLSSVHEPHMHVSAARPVALPSRPGSTEGAEMVLSRVHFPTHNMELSGLIRFLIMELGVEPRRMDWEAVIDRAERSAR